MDFDRRILPYYMTYPGPYGTRREDTVIRDMEYLQQMYPLEIKRYQRRVAAVLDRMDYEGSMIYDEYPDPLIMRMKCREICKEVQREDDAEDVLMDICQILLYHEMYLRRCKRREQRRRRFF